MNTLQIQDAFQPYYSGRNQPRDDADPAAEKSKDSGLTQQKRAAQRIRNGLQASRQVRKREVQD